MIRNRVILLALILTGMTGVLNAAPGDWTMYQYDELNTGYNPHSMVHPPFLPVWSKKFSNSQLMPVTTYEGYALLGVSSLPRDSADYIFCFDVETGDIVWTDSVTGYCAWLSQAAAGNGFFYLQAARDSTGGPQLAVGFSSPIPIRSLSHPS